MSSAATGRFITLEGGEGAGKSTQIARLSDWLRQKGRTVVTTREPGGSPGAEMIRKLLVEGPAERWDGTTEALLHFAARREHLRSTVWPALRRGDWKLVLDSPYAPVELYHLGRDPGETTNLAAKEPKILAEMSAALRRHIQRGGRVAWQAAEPAQSENR